MCLSLHMITEGSSVQSCLWKKMYSVKMESYCFIWYLQYVYYWKIVISWQWKNFWYGYKQSWPRPRKSFLYQLDFRVDCHGGALTAVATAIRTPRQEANKPGADGSHGVQRCGEVEHASVRTVRCWHLDHARLIRVHQILGSLWGHARWGRSVRTDCSLWLSLTHSDVHCEVPHKGTNKHVHTASY